MNRFDRITTSWVYGGSLAGVLLLVLMPALVRGWPFALTVVLLMLPVYMLHQYEEHDDDRFRLFCNHWIGHDRDILPHIAVFIINIPGVWGVIALSFYLADFVSIGFGLIAVYLPIINGLLHIGQAIAMRRYNPGLLTAIALFLPIGAYAIWQIDLAGGGAWYYHLIGIGTAIAIHAAIIAYVASRGAFMPKTTP